MQLDTSRRVITKHGCKELVPGAPYFQVTYQHEGVNLPEVETLVYLGAIQVKVEEGQLQTRFVFQLAWSYHQDGNWIELPKERRKELTADASVLLWAEDSLRFIEDIDGLLVLLNNLREKMRRGWGWERVLPPQER